ncbi:hypothetical protein PoB_004450900 [Plakobranchus ocellatus]|uniref:Uncharacterized protein n=1 Tax=Plakobranchus ocellatus TaxID=259542 RepID=A0AAV4BCZ6_9GAST|nr:hypothetical protein PoB_004450900 [Plakobranchus ocellatus]
MMGMICQQKHESSSLPISLLRLSQGSPDKHHTQACMYKLVSASTLLGQRGCYIVACGNLLVFSPTGLRYSTSSVLHLLIYSWRSVRVRDKLCGC